MFISSIGWLIDKISYLGLMIDMRSADKQGYIDQLMQSLWAHFPKLIPTQIYFHPICHGISVFLPQIHNPTHMGWATLAQEDYKILSNPASSQTSLSKYDELTDHLLTVWFSNTLPNLWQLHSLALSQNVWTVSLIPPPYIYNFFHAKFKWQYLHCLSNKSIPLPMSLYL